MFNELVREKAKSTEPTIRKESQIHLPSIDTNQSNFKGLISVERLTIDEKLSKNDVHQLKNVSTGLATIVKKRSKVSVVSKAKEEKPPESTKTTADEKNGHDTTAKTNERNRENKPGPSVEVQNQTENEKKVKKETKDTQKTINFGENPLNKKCSLLNSILSLNTAFSYFNKFDFVLFFRK